MKDITNNNAKCNTKQTDNVYEMFNITDDQRLLFYKMAKEWSIIPKEQEIKPYDTNPINTNIRGFNNA